MSEICCKEKHGHREGCDDKAENHKHHECCDKLKLSAMEFGFDSTWVNDLLSRWGEQVLGVVIQAVRLGFSKETVIEILTKLGPMFLEMLVSLSDNFFKSPRLSVAAGVTLDEAKQVALEDSMLDSIIRKYLTMLVQKYGDKIVNLAVDWLRENILPKVA